MVARTTILEALLEGQVRLLTRPIIGPIVGLFYLAAAVALAGALLGIPANQVRAWWGVPDAALDDTDAGGDDDAGDGGDDDAVPSE